MVFRLSKIYQIFSGCNHALTDTVNLARASCTSIKRNLPSDTLKLNISHDIDFGAIS